MLNFFIHVLLSIRKSIVGDVLVFVNDTCVLGFTQEEAVKLFQQIPVDSEVQLQVG